ncbi:hypothetical protein BDV41DRAFT_490328 [Aspergillus transmontanensis]|uniref:Uncharacterized protein n=1 Tax=Aspergillus transmontanensis TaxID=1034304 RepID=A0A5N6WAR2_9EURO|nr:hypothetical protein BDV41DRAFT_490328 [Aspergillus transmontanensis]
MSNPCRSLTIISSWILSLSLFFLLFPYLPDVLPISMDSMVFSIHTGHCILTLLFVLSLHFSALPMVVDGGQGQESWVMLESEHRCIY